MESLVAVLIVMLTAYLTWLFDKKKTREEIAHNWKRDRYTELINSFPKKYKDDLINEKELSEFIRQLNLCTLYCSSEVIKAGRNFLLTVYVGQNYSDELQERAYFDLFVAIRKDLMGDQDLNLDDLRYHTPKI